MRRECSGFSIIELGVVVTIILIIVAFSIPILSKTLIAYRTRATAEALAAQLYLARQSAINFGRRAGGPVTVYMYPGTSSKGAGIWFDRNNTATSTTAPVSPPDSETVYLQEGVVVGNDIAASPQCGNSPLQLAQFNSRGELPLGYTPTSQGVPCLANSPSGTNFTVNIYVETIKGSTIAVSKYLVGITPLGSVSVLAR